ncbi:MAG: hypothetical protein KU37_11880 [Sulfuricurvum sp. PC08-66]|nr:MAG: hypothetical protein KU37_11880 [Sulfuricurvum sp. PC08-66]
MKQWIVALLLVVGMAWANEEGNRVVFDLKTGDIASFEQKILKGIAFHKAHYEGSLGSLEVAVVIHGDAYKFFLKNLKNSPYAKESQLVAMHAELTTRIAAVAENYEVEFLMCEATMRTLKIDPSNVYDFVKLVPNSTIGLINKQNEGYAYIPAHY